METSPNHTYKNPEVSRKVKEMFNKPKYSDSIFLVNQTKFHTSSHLVSVSCRELEIMLDNHYENCGDREVKIGHIKHEASFSVILKDIYGMEINFTELSKDVLCEVLCLSEQYELTNLFNELKLFVSNLDLFEVESIVILLNTARKYKLTDLYEKAKTFSSENSERLVEHESFSDLQYDILLEFISSDWFYADEINILSSALTWHSRNINSPDDIEKKIGGNAAEDKIEESVNTVEKCSQAVALDISSETSTDTFNHQLTMLRPRGNNEEVFETFSKKILLSLLAHVRLELIPWVQMKLFSYTELFAKYKDYLDMDMNASPIGEARKKITGLKRVPRKIVIDVTRNFTVEWDDFNVTYESNEELQVAGIKLKVCAMFTFTNENGKNLDNNVRRLEVFLKGESIESGNWACKVECQIKLNSRIPKQDPSLYLPGDNTFTFVTLSSDSSHSAQGKVGSFYFPCDSYGAYASTDGFSFEVLFKGIHSKLMT